MRDQDLEEKFLSQVDSVLPKDQSRVLLEQLWEIEKPDDLKALFSLMRVPIPG